MASIREQLPPNPVSEPIPAFFLDAGLTWRTPQQNALALALAVRERGFAPRVFCPAASVLAMKAQEATIPFVPLESKGLFGLLRLWLAQKRARPLCVHTFADASLPLAARLLGLRRPGSTVLVHSCFEFSAALAPPAVWAVVDKVVCANTVLRAHLVEAGLDPARLVVVHPGQESAFLPPRRERGDGRFVFMATESLLPESGLDVLLKAMAALWQRTDLTPWEVRVVGSGPAFDQLLEEAGSLGVAARLALLSDQPLEAVLPQGDALVAPGVALQGNMAALLAAWCVGLPLICSTVPVHMEVVASGQGPARAGRASALTVPPGDPQTLASAMIRVMSDAPLRLQLTQQADAMRAYAAFDRMAGQCLPLYRDCVGRRGWVLPSVPSASSAPSTPAAE